MTRRLVLASMMAAALAGCRSTSPPPPSGSEAGRADGTSGGNAVAAQKVRDPKAEVDTLLAAAQDAVVRGEVEEFHDCEAAIYQSLLQSPDLAIEPPGPSSYKDDVLDELMRLAEQVEDGDVGEEPPPEPQPVPEERVAEVQQQARSAHFDLPVVINAEVTSLIDFYTGRYRERFIAALQRGAPYLPYIRQQLHQGNMPEDLAYLPLVESAFNTRARSRARAQGMWQFMAGTAKLYGLECNGLVDERNDPYLATQAAVRHLSDLYGMFGSWELALAAYNSGAGKVQYAIRRAKGNTDFWTVRRYLRRETRNYVPALWAVVVATKNPAAYGLPEIEENPVCVARVPVEGALDLDVLAERGRLDAEELAAFNPALTHRLTSAGGSYQLAVPCGREEQVAEVIASIPVNERVRRFLHVVKSGDTLGTIARRYGSTVDAIMAANGIRNPRSLRIGQTLVVPRGPVDHPSRVAEKRVPAGEKVAAAAPSRYVVRPGDTLYSIARRFGTSTEELQRRNGLPDSTIRPGDVLLLTR
ncbi:MAG TPA: LysM peptidoglycan-binding domain-containing protein [Thermoanaerobaculaceae bacterium]|nr:LysM peptidoglycan-binding domain-containing protein [Thermoanaerobaculaceae bacterium]